MSKRPPTEIFCEFCDAKLNFKTQNRHFQICKYAMECELPIYRRSKPEEKKDESVVCKFCGENFNVEMINDHYKICTKTRVPCPLQCGVVPIQRKELSKHLKESCTGLNTTCTYNYVGCKFKGSTASMKQHIDESSLHHLGLLETYVNQLKLELAQKDTKLTEIQTQLKANEKESLKKLRKTVEKLTEAKNKSEAFEEKTTQSLQLIIKTMKRLTTTVKYLNQTQKQSTESTEKI